MGPGLFVTFFDSGEPFDRELPPVGPLDRVALDGRRLRAERLDLAHAPEDAVDIAKRLEAELELQRALGEERGEPKRSNMRVSARDGVYVRFVSTDGKPTDERGPYAVIVIGRRSIEADGAAIATRGDEDAPWEIDGGGVHHVGLRSATGRHRETTEEARASGRAPSERPRATVDSTDAPAHIEQAAMESSFEPHVFRERERREREIYSPPGSHTAGAGRSGTGGETLHTRLYGAVERQADPNATIVAHAPEIDEGLVAVTNVRRRVKRRRISREAFAFLVVIGGVVIVLSAYVTLLLLYRR